MTIVIETVNGMQFEIEATKVDKAEIDGEVIYYANGESFPEQIVKEIKD